MRGPLSFRDLFKDSFLKSDFFGPVNFSDILLALIITLILSLFIFYVYKSTYSGVMYSHNYNSSLVLMALITAVIISTISSNLVLSLGMVGALSIVRFRTVVKDPVDMVFMFWAIGLGITTGARLYMGAITGTLFIGVVTLLLLRYKNSNNIFLLVVHYREEGREKLFQRLQELDYNIKSKTVSNETIELTLELKIIGTDTSFIEQLAEIEGVSSVSLVSYNGNFVG